LQLQDVKITTANGHPQVTAVKSWNFGGQRDWSGRVMTHLAFERENGKWVISSEREGLITQSIPFKQGSAEIAGKPH
jgi:hypothetical protein